MHHLFVLKFCVGLFLITKGAGWFTDASVSIANKMKVPKVVIGATLVSIFTTLPEFSVSFLASVRGQPDTSLGNAVGSVICNLGLVLSVAAIISPVSITREIKGKSVLMFVIGIFLFSVSYFFGYGFINRTFGIVLLLIAILYLIFSSLGENSEECSNEYEQGLSKTILFFALGGSFVLIGSSLVVSNVIPIARYIGVPEIIVALTLVAIGTSLPELVMAVVSSIKGHSGIALGNVVGANILNLTWVIGSAALYSALKIDTQTFLFDFPIMILFMGLFLLFILLQKNIKVYSGLFLLAFYIFYVVVSFFC
ncbi:MAG: calcium/sodium antiporter [Nitrospinota bacterium]|nr:calcium/sodium antiporter [Nitrospinota bacterium]